VCLDDIQEVSSRVGYGTLGKKGNSGMPDITGVIYKGAAASHAIALHPSTPLCANMTETLAPLFITVEGQEGNSHGKDHEQ
jgi:hypothetical protein